jgi:hypothetical protein
MLEKAREGATKGNAGAIKSAVSIYYGDNTGAWPTDINPTASLWFTKYLDVLPPVKATHPVASLGGVPLSGTCNTALVVAVSATIDTVSDGWKYNKSAGDVWVNNSQTDTGGVQYSMYGF